MMTKRMARTGLFASVLAAAVICMMMIVSQAAYADGPDGSAVYGKKITISKANYMVLIDMGKKGKGATKVTVKSSNKKVAEPSEMTDYIKAPVLKVGKKGTATITIKIKTKKGTKTYKSKMKVVAYKNPAKKVTIGGKNITKKFKKHPYLEEYTPSAAKEKLVVKPAKGWKIKSIRQIYVLEDYHNKKIKNKSKIKWHGNDQIVITLINKSKNQIEELSIMQLEEL